MQQSCMVIHSLRQLHIVNFVDYIHSLRQSSIGYKIVEDYFT